jgi:carboxylesterase
MRWLGRNLAESGFTSLGVRLFAHATQPDDLKRAHRGDWKASVLDGYHLLQSQCDNIFMIGLSMGAVLTMSLAPQLDVSGLVVMSTPIEMPDKLAQRLRPILPWLSLVMPTMGKGKPDWADPSASEGHVEYPDFIVAAVPQLADQIKEMRDRLAQIHCPVLLMSSHRDRAVSIDHSRRILDELGADDKQLIPFERSGHNMPLDADRERILEETISFMRRVTGERS